MKKQIMAGCIATGVGLLIGTQNGNSQPTGVPELQEVYGGRVESICPIAISSNSTRIYASTESANSVFYGDVDYTKAEPFSTNNFKFNVVPDLSAAANFGVVRSIAAHRESGKLFFADGRAIYSCNKNAGSIQTNIAVLADVPTMLIRRNTFLAIDWESAPPYRTTLIVTTIAADGSLGADVKRIQLDGGLMWPVLLVHPTNNLVYIFGRRTPNVLLKSDDTFDALTTATTFTNIALPAPIPWVGDSSFGIGPDGRIFVGGSGKVIAYSDNEGASWNVVSNGMPGGTYGPNIECVGTADEYRVYFGAAISTNKGVDGSWGRLPLPGGTAETHPNDGECKADPLDPKIIYMTTDQGIGTTTNAGRDIFEIDYGLVAVQIEDFDMTDAKDVAWSASKSGIRKGTGSAGNIVWTPNGMFPMDDGAPFYSIAVNRADTSGNSVYAGNNRIYKTTDGGTNWERVWDVEGDTNGFLNGGYISALEADGDIVFAGYHGRGSETNSGMLASDDGGRHWIELIKDVNVTDIKYVRATGEIYVSIDYINGVGGVFYISDSNTVEHSLTDNVSIRKLAIDSAGGVYADRKSVV
jgi:hypothetical protein